MSRRTFGSAGASSRGLSVPMPFFAFCLNSRAMRSVLARILLSLVRAPLAFARVQRAIPLELQPKDALWPS
jgi:hypothetical protein